MDKVLGTAGAICFLLALLGVFGLYQFGIAPPFILLLAGVILISLGVLMDSRSD